MSRAADIIQDAAIAYSGGHSVDFEAAANEVIEELAAKADAVPAGYVFVGKVFCYKNNVPKISWHQRPGDKGTELYAPIKQGAES